ncbi:retrovirus-related pol polyprotein from transposon TNT 1-94 [Tanacetum coccineum]|uniref:Retrovirus-related pol polyprotein from transposon TNT 1-94 n=1 Tax=Tanacetum coccineum TaxID=301880 RepID=A0ABQ5DXD7_9ASTR
MLMKPQFFYDHTTKQTLSFQNPFYLKKAQQLEPKLYVGDIIEKTNAIVIPDSEETLMLAGESRSKMLLKQKDPIMLENKVNTTLNFVNSAEPTISSRPTNVEVPKELPKVSMVNTSLKKLKHHLAGFDVEKVLEITALKDDLRKLKGKTLVDNAVTKHTIDPEMLKIDDHSLESAVGVKNRLLDSGMLDTGFYYVEGLGTQLLLRGKFCDSNNLKLLFAYTPDFIRNLEDMMVSSLICLLSKASKTKSWLWHRRLSHLNFGAINHLARHDLVRGLPKLKFEKDHLCSTCEMGKSKKKSYTPKSEDTNQDKLYLLHMDLCGLIRLASVNGTKYILVIVDDYSRFTWVKFLRSKDEAPYFIIKFLKMIQVRIKVPVQRIRTDNGTKFVNQTLCEYYEKVGISYETYVARSLRKNGVVERRNCTLIEAAPTMLIYAKALLFL